jgi:GTP-binding protein
MNPTPVAAIVGRPNVGKSTLFNRLLGRRQAIVHDQPGVTRDRIAGLAELGPERGVQIVDTGGLVLDEDPLGLGRQVLLAVEESDLLLLVVDGEQGLVPADQRVWEALRPYGKPTILVVNKGDVRAAEAGFAEFYRLGVATQILVSAEHGRGIEELREALRRALPAVPGVAPPEAPAIAIVGRPNVGKSSLVNRIAGAERVLVSPHAGTTRDPVDTLIERGDRRYLLIDTAGIRRRSQASGTPEELAVLFARRQLERADLALLVLDATQSVTSSDLAIAGTLWELGRAAVVAINKWDLVDGEARERLEGAWPRLAEILADPERVNVSSLSGRGVEKLFPAIDRTLADYRRSLGTGEVNRLFTTAIARHHPPALRGKPWKLYYATQVAVGPPTFMLFANRALPRSDPYRRYLENRIREHLGLRGVPVRLVVRRKEERGGRSRRE